VLKDLQESIFHAWQYTLLKNENIRKATFRYLDVGEYCFEQSKSIMGKLLKDNKIEAPTKDAVKEVKLLAQKVIEMAELVSKNPGDTVAQAKLSAVQKELGLALEKKVVELTSKQNLDLENSLQEMKKETDSKGNISGQENNILQSAQAVLDEIANFFTDKKMTPAQVISASKSLSTKATELSKQLLEMAEKTTDPIYKQKLISSARLIKDGTIQIKILSAVRAAGGDDKTNTIQNAFKTLQSNIDMVVQTVTAESLRTKFKSTVKQTVAMNKLLTHWRKNATN